MCGRFAQRPILDFGLPSLVDLAPALAEMPPSYNLAPPSVRRPSSIGEQAGRCRGSRGACFLFGQRPRV